MKECSPFHWWEPNVESETGWVARIQILRPTVCRSHFNKSKQILTAFMSRQNKPDNLRYFVMSSAVFSARGHHIFVNWSRSGELRTQKLKSPLMRTQSLKILHLKPGVGQYIATQATPRDFFLDNFYSSGPFTCMFFKTSSRFFLF